LRFDRTRSRSDQVDNITKARAGKKKKGEKQSSINLVSKFYFETKILLFDIAGDIEIRVLRSKSRLRFDANLADILRCALVHLSTTIVNVNSAKS